MRLVKINDLEGDTVSPKYINTDHILYLEERRGVVYVWLRGKLPLKTNQKLSSLCGTIQREGQ